MKNNINYRLYLCTDRDLMTTQTIEESVELAIKGGCTIVQLREKDCSSKDFYDQALRIKKVTDYYQVPFIINDRVDIALAVDADGVHVGQSDLPAKIVRSIIGKDKILGVSAATIEEAKKAVIDGADYIGVGAMNATATKTDARSVTIDGLKAIRSQVSIPIVAIGGINKQTIPMLKGTGIDGVAVVSAIVAQKDITKAAKELALLTKDL